MSKIKTRETHKNIKALDKAAVAAERMKDSFVRSKETAAKLSEEGHGSPNEYAGDKVQQTAADGARDAAYLAAEQGKRLAVKTRDAIRNRSAETAHETEGRFFGSTPEGTVPSQEAQIERARLYAKQAAQSRAADPQRQPKTLEQSVGRQPSIKTVESATAESKPSPMEQGQQMAINQAKIKAKERQAARTRELSVSQAMENKAEPPAYPPSRYSPSTQPSSIRQREALTDTGRVKRSQQDAVKTIRERDRSRKRSSRSMGRREGRPHNGPRRLTQKRIKTAEQTSRATIKTAQVSAMRARQATQSAAVTAQRTAQASRAAKAAAVTTAKAASRAAREMARAIATAARSLFTAFAAGGPVAMIVVVLICMIGLIAGSCFGVVFASEDSGTGLTLQSAVLQINGDFSGRIENVKKDYEGRYDSVELINADGITNWPDVIAVYAVKSTTDKDAAEEVATVTQKKIDRLREVCWDMNPITAKLVAGEESTVLQITVTAKSYTDMIEEYGFDEDQKKMVTELMNSCLLDKYKNLTTPAEVEGDFAAIEGTGGYIWPLNGYTRTSSPFGYRICPFHGRELHGGVDIPAPYGTAVHAAKSGTVVKSTYGSSYGNHIIIAHGDGTRTLYAHMSARLVSVGQTVSQGQTIGKVGSTGSSTGNHLHFETWTGSSSSTRVNPMRYF